MLLSLSAALLGVGAWMAAMGVASHAVHTTPQQERVFVVTALRGVAETASLSCQGFKSPSQSQLILGLWLACAGGRVISVPIPGRAGEVRLSRAGAVTGGWVNVPACLTQGGPGPCSRRRRGACAQRPRDWLVSARTRPPDPANTKKLPCVVPGASWCWLAAPRVRGDGPLAASPIRRRLTVSPSTSAVAATVLADLVVIATVTWHLVLVLVPIAWAAIRELLPLVWSAVEQVVHALAAGSR